jgi:hypothetical protein
MYDESLRARQPAWRSGVLALLVLVATPRSAFGNGPARARQLAAAAEAAAARKDFSAAIDLYRQARQLDDRVEYVCNIGAAYYKTDRLPQAHTYLQLCLGRSAGLDEAYARGLREAFGYIERKLRGGEYAPVDIVVKPAGAILRPDYLPADEGLPGSRTLWFAYGTHHIEVRAPGHVTRRLRVDISDRARFPVSVELVAERTPPPVPTRPRTVLVRPSRVPAWLTLGSSAALAAGGVVFHTLATDTRAQLEPLAEGPQRDRKLDEFHRERMIAIVCYAASAAAAGVGAVLWYRAATASPIRVDATPAANGGGLSLWLSAEF